MTISSYSIFFSYRASFIYYEWLQLTSVYQNLHVCIFSSYHSFLQAPDPHSQLIAHLKHFLNISKAPQIQLMVSPRSWSYSPPPPVFVYGTTRLSRMFKLETSESSLIPSLPHFPPCQSNPGDFFFSSISLSYPFFHPHCHYHSLIVIIVSLHCCNSLSIFSSLSLPLVYSHIAVSFSFKKCTCNVWILAPPFTSYVTLGKLLSLAKP